MKKPVKIILLVSLALNLILACFQLYSYFERQQRIAENKDEIKKYTEQRIVNSPVVKKSFFDSLYINYPDLRRKKYLFINIWRTADAWTDRVLPIYDSIIQPLRDDIGYLTLTEENKKYARSILKQDTSLINNFDFIYSAERFILALNQDLKIPFRKYGYPKYSMNFIFNNKTKEMIFCDTVAISGPKYPEDSLSDRKVIASIKKALSELK